MQIQDYLNLIPSSNAQQPNFIATISAVVSPCVQVQNLLQAMIPLFDLSTPPVGNQLDIIGQWVGVTRNVAIITNIFFSWDDGQALGWDYGSWAPNPPPTQITSLPDDAYLTLILAKIASNNWDGTTNGAYAIWNELLAGQGITILIQDYQNMSYSLGIQGATIPTLTLALITAGYIDLRPEGVEIIDYFSGPGPFFAWDVAAGPNLAGWDSGNWATVTPAT
jgi:hypothetical protein